MKREYLSSAMPYQSQCLRRGNDFKGEYNETQSYAAGEIVRRQSSLWSADISITGAETNIQFDSFASVPQIIDTFIQYNVSEIMIDKLNLKPGIMESIEKRLSGHEMYSFFLKNVIENKSYYNNIRNELIEISNRKNLKILDAF